MPKIPQKWSVILSMIMNGILAVIIAVMCVSMPEWLGWLLEICEKPKELLVPTLVTVYFTAVLAYLAITLLFALLMCIKRGEVFTNKTVSYLRAMSWLCIIAACCYAVLGLCYPVIAVLIAFACLFMGIVLRVVKNSFEKAAEIKAENDFTV